MNPAFGWRPITALSGEWYLSPDGDLCKAVEDGCGGVVAIRRGGGGVWIGSKSEFADIFAPARVGHASKKTCIT